MQIHLDTTKGNIINSYTNHSVSVNAIVYTHTILLNSSTIKTFEHIHDPSTELLESAAQLAIPDNAVVILGFKEKAPPMDKQWYHFFAQHQLMLEIMSLPAACRTYNILLSDDRPVVAMLII